MESTREIGGNPTQPALADLMARFLTRQVEHLGSGSAQVGISGEVFPFDACPVMPVDSRLAWDGAVAALKYFQPEADLTSRKWMPPDWPALVALHEPAAGLTLASGNFPQLVRSLHNLVHAKDFSSLAPTAARPLQVPTLADWARGVAQKGELPRILLAAGVLRLARHFELAQELLNAPAGIPAQWRGAWHNERAALAWHRGEAEKAAADWQSQESTIPVLFNRGVAALFANQPKEARSWFNLAVSTMKEDDAWRHLGLLYVALAEMRI